MSETNHIAPTCVFVVLLDGDLVQTPEHLGVSYLMAVLRQRGYDCELVDVAPGEEHDALERTLGLAPRFVGLSLTTVNLPRAQAFGRDLRERLGAAVHICAGGPIATFLGDRLLQIPQWSFIDSIVRGEGEEVLVPLVEAVHRNAPRVPMRGVTFRGGPIGLPPVVAVDHLDSLPWPARDQLERRLAAGGTFPYVRLSTSRGCTSRCTFCNAPHAGNNLAKRKGWRGREPEDVVDEIEFLGNRYDVDTFDFVDSTFEDPGGGKLGKERVRRLAQAILDRELVIYYNICSQAKNWHEEDRPLLQLLFESGLEKVLIGIESGSDRVLSLFKKSSNVADNRRAIRLFREEGVYVAFGFIMFQPYSEWQDLEENANFLLDEMGHNLRRFVTRLELYPGAEIVHQLEADGLLDEDYWQTLRPYAYTHVEPKVARMAQMLNRLFGPSYFLQGTISEEPSVFRFETYDITLHTYLSRLRRTNREVPPALEVISRFEDQLDREKQRLAQFNADLFFEVMERARAEKDLPDGLAERVERRYGEAMETMQTIQMRLGMNLRRSSFATTISRRVSHG